MTSSSKKFVGGLLLFLVAGGLIGGIYDNVLVGSLLAALLLLLWQVRQLLTFEKAIRTNDFDDFRYGEGIWEQIFSRFQFERERAIRRKRNYRTLLREIRETTDAMPDGAAILDINGEIIVSNRAARKLAGLKRKKDKGQRVENILRDPQVTGLIKDADFARAIDIPSPVADGNWLNCRVVPYGADQTLLLLQDVTERKKMNKMRRDFVANASHELRSPLTVISAYIDTLGEDPHVPAEWVKPIAQMQSQAARMEQILKEMLELSRIESSGVAATDEAVDVIALLEKVRDDYQHAGIANIVIESSSSTEFLGVHAELESVIVNLLTNAIRHTPEDGQISLSWNTHRSGAKLVVADTGEGVDAENIPRLTERFFRVDRGRSRSDGGIGLGLAIVKHVLARHDGRLEIVSRRGAGSVFTCHFASSRVRNAEDAVPS